MKKKLSLAAWPPCWRGACGQNGVQGQVLAPTGGRPPHLGGRMTKTPIPPPSTAGAYERCDICRPSCLSSATAQKHPDLAHRAGLA